MIRPVALVSLVVLLIFVLYVPSRTRPSGSWRNCAPSRV